MAEYKREIFLKESCPALLNLFSQNLRKFCGEEITLGGRLGIFIVSSAEKSFKKSSYVTDQFCINWFKTTLFISSIDVFLPSYSLILSIVS